MTKRILTLTITVFLALSLLCSCADKTKAENTTDHIILKDPIGTEIALGYATEMTYTYFYPVADGSITSATYTEQLDKGKSVETMQSHLDRFFGYCGISGITLINSEVEGTDVTETKDYGGETVVVHTPGEKTLVLTLEGDAELSEAVKECLIKTLEDISYCKYFKVIYNNEVIFIDGAIAEN